MTHATPPCSPSPSPRPCCATRAARITFTDLNPDVLLHIASFASSPPPSLGVHWLNVTQGHASNADVRALRATCTHARAAIPLGSACVRIRDDWDTHGQLARWACAPGEVLARVKHITLSTSGRGDYFVPPSTAQARFEAFTTLLTRSPHLEGIEVAHNPFCPHDAYGLGRERIFALTPPPTTHPRLERVTTLSVALKCRICAVELARTLSSWCPSLHSLRASLVTFVPPARVLPPLVARLGGLRKLHLKVGDEWGVAALLAALSPCVALEELHVAPYDASRKVQVVDSLRAPEGILGLNLPASGVVETFLSTLNAFPNLDVLDLCLSPAAIDSSLADDEDRSTAWRAGATEAARQIAEACPSLRQGWWWIQVVDLDYRQLKGYERWSWTVEGGEVVLATEPRRLAPLVVRNQDGQGTTVEIPSEGWN